MNGRTYRWTTDEVIIPSAPITGVGQPCIHILYAMVTCEIKLFQNYFSFCRCPTEIILFQRVETWPRLFQNYFTGL